MRAILTYHSIDDSGSPISVSAAAFRAHRRWLASGRVRAVSLDELVTTPHDAPDAVAVTFDDGFLNTAEAIGSLLGDGIPATVFVVTGQVGATNAWGGRVHKGIPTLPLMTWSHVERLASGGAHIGAHTRTHRHLTRLEDDALDEELSGCADDLEGRLGSRPSHLAYPFGDVNDRIAARTAKHFRFGHSTHFGVLDGIVAPMRLPRLDMFYFTRTGAIDAWGTSRFSWRLDWIRAWRRIGRRLSAALEG